MRFASAMPVVDGADAPSYRMPANCVPRSRFGRSFAGANQGASGTRLELPG